MLIKKKIKTIWLTISTFTTILFIAPILFACSFNNDQISPENSAILNTEDEVIKQGGEINNLKINKYFIVLEKLLKDLNINNKTNISKLNDNLINDFLTKIANILI